MLLQVRVKPLDEFPVFRRIGSFQKHATLPRSLCIPILARAFEIAFNSALLFPIGLSRGCTALRSISTSPHSRTTPRTRLRMGWACATCTFINDAGSACGVCLMPAPGSPSSGDAKWTCEACTFENIGETAFCEMCDTGRSTVGRSVRGSPFRPLRASARVKPEVGRVEESALLENVKSVEAESLVTGGTWFGDESLKVACGSQNLKSRKHEAKEVEVIDLSESDSRGDEFVVKDGKKKKDVQEESNHLLENLHKERISRMQGKMSAEDSSAVKVGKDAVDSSSSSPELEKEKEFVPLTSLSREQKLAYIEAEGTWLEKPTADLTVLSYNVWFREDLELQARLDAIGNVILQHRPHVVFFQEVTETIYRIFEQASWWKSYNCSVNRRVASQRAYFCMVLSKLPVVSFRQSPFRNSIMGRELCLAELDVGNGARLLVANSHLESPCPAPPTWNQMFSAERVAQAKEAMLMLKDFPNVIFGGDMNWDEKTDGVPPLPSGWFDAWVQLRPGEDGFTYDTKANKMISGYRSLRKRVDRMFCQLEDFDTVSIEMVGTEPIPDLTYPKEKKVKGKVEIIRYPVLPSDHFGLLLTLRKSA